MARVRICEMVLEAVCLVFGLFARKSCEAAYESRPLYLERFDDEHASWHVQSMAWIKEYRLILIRFNVL